MEEKIMVFRGRSYQDWVTDEMWSVGEGKSRVTFDLLALLLVDCGAEKLLVGMVERRIPF